MTSVQAVNPPVLKILVLGESGVGKTNILKRYVHGYFGQETPTCGAGFFTKVVTFTNGDRVSLLFWDIAGPERYGPYTQAYYKSAIGAIIVGDVAKRESFDQTSAWKADLDSKVTFPFAPEEDVMPIPAVLVANKVDLEATRVITSAEIAEKARNDGYVAWCETSARKGEGLERAFDLLVSEIIRKTQIYRSLQNSQSVVEALRDYSGGRLDRRKQDEAADTVAAAHI